MRTHLHRREGGTYYFRRAIPAKLRPHFDGKREWIVSLRTKDRAEAKSLIPHYVLAFDARVREALALSPLRVPEMVASDPPKAGIPEGTKVSLLGMFEAYATEQRLKPATAAEWRAMVKVLRDFIGHDDAEALTVDELDRWRDKLLTEPGRKGKLRAPGTVKDKYLSSVRATLAWGVEKRLITRNVASLVKVRVPRVAKVRERDFSADEATRILSASLQSSWSDVGHHEARARRWVPWICAYTGARVNEIGQLRGTDVSQIEGVWALRITPEAGTVKNNTARLVPLHADLIGQGFHKVALSCGDHPIFYSVDRIRSPGPSNRYFKKVGERLRDWIRGEVGITDLNVQPNHAWRHTFKTRALDAGIPERVADAIQGHAPRSVGQTYGSVSLAAKAKAIASLPRFLISDAASD